MVNWRSLRILSVSTYCCNKQGIAAISVRHVHMHSPCLEYADDLCTLSLGSCLDQLLGGHLAGESGGSEPAVHTVTYRPTILAVSLSPIPKPNSAQITSNILDRNETIRQYDKDFR